MTIKWILSVTPISGLFFWLIFLIVSLILTVIDKSFYPKESFWELLKPNVFEAIKGACFSFLVVIGAGFLMYEMFIRLA